MLPCWSDAVGEKVSNLKKYAKYQKLALAKQNIDQQNCDTILQNKKIFLKLGVL